MVRFHISHMPETIGECLHSAFPDEALMWAHAYYRKIATDFIWALPYNTEFFKYYYGRYEYPYEIHDLGAISQILETERLELQRLYPKEICDADAIVEQLRLNESTDFVDELIDPYHCPPMNDGFIGVSLMDYLETMVRDGCSDPHFLAESMIDYRHWYSGVSIEQWAVFVAEDQIGQLVAQIKSEIL